jgi:molybdopterin molybdotransferase
MLSLDEARARLLANVRRLSSERLPIGDGAGRVLAEDLVARQPLPPFDYSAMDGYALRASDLKGDPPWTLQVAGEAGAGRSPPALEPGTACRIFTGARLPERANAVVMQEHVTREADRINLPREPNPGQNIRRAGEDIAPGAVAIAAGTRLTAGALALAAMLDRGELVVRRRPIVTVLCTGDELRPPGSAARPDSIPESNSVALAALAAHAGAAVRTARIAPDDPHALLQAVEEALQATDVLVTVGGVSVGDHDHVRPALERAGVAMDFWKVAIKPGKPMAVGATEGTRVLGLPGNPASALVTWALFGMPLLRALQGDAGPLPLALRLPVAAGRARSPDRVELLRASLSHDGAGGLVVRAHDNQASGAATSLARSDGLAMVPPGPHALAAGTPVDFFRWNDF